MGFNSGFKELILSVSEFESCHSYPTYGMALCVRMSTVALFTAQK